MLIINRPKIKVMLRSQNWRYYLAEVLIKNIEMIFREEIGQFKAKRNIRRYTTIYFDDIIQLKMNSVINL